MAHHKKKTKRTNKKKNQGDGIDINTLLIIGLIITFIYGGQNGWFGTHLSFTDEQTNLFNTPGTSGTEGCKITLDDDEYCVGDIVTAVLTGEPDTIFYIGVNQDNLGWELFETATTDSAGTIKRSGPIGSAGNYKVRAISDYCVTNLVEADVIVCDDSPSDEDCWWQSVAESDVTVPAGIFSNWNGVLVDGKFKFEWDYEFLGVDTEISHNAILDYSSPSRTGKYEFTATSGQTWQISSINDLSSPSDIHTELFQWVCEGDDLNWNPNMYGSMGQASPEDTDKTCEEYCQDEWGYYGVCGIPPPGMKYDTLCIDPANSYYLANVFADQWCEQNIPTYEYCCCWEVQPN